LGLGGEPPTERTLRYWRTSGFLSHSERRFTEREALEALTIHALQQQGLKLGAIHAQVRSCTLEELRKRLEPSSSDALSIESQTSERVANLASDVTVLLAQGVMQAFKLVQSGSFIQQDDTMPRELQAALSRLGRLYLEEGQEDGSASVHDVLARCQTPLREWGLRVFAHPGFAFADAVLVDADLRVPTPECVQIASSAGPGVENVLEERLHRQLRQALEALRSEANMAYTQVREFLARNSLTTLSKLLTFCNDAGFPTRLISLLTQEFYQRVPEAWLIAGQARRCAHCGTLLRPSSYRRDYLQGRCPLSACRWEHEATEIGEVLDPEEALVVRSVILSYWVNPAIDELRIFDAAIVESLPAQLYPDGDRCDVCLNADIGVDVKTYASPITLARTLNDSISGLETYSRRIIAVPNGITEHHSQYLRTLRSALETPAARSLEVMSVSGVLRLIQRLVSEGRGFRA
jgi:DNA-binding transcriptional MerR regulator